MNFVGVPYTNGDAAFDDQTSTFIIPSGAGFEVVFCPGARSTNILATESDKMLQLAQNGHVSNDKNDQSRMMQDKRSGAMRSINFEHTVLLVTFVLGALSFTVLC